MTRTSLATFMLCCTILSRELPAQVPVEAMLKGSIEEAIDKIASSADYFLFCPSTSSYLDYPERGPRKSKGLSSLLGSAGSAWLENCQRSMALAGNADWQAPSPLNSVDSEDYFRAKEMRKALVAIAVSSAKARLDVTLAAINTSLTSGSPACVSVRNAKSQSAAACLRSLKSDVDIPFQQLIEGESANVRANRVIWASAVLAMVPTWSASSQNFFLVMPASGSGLMLKDSRVDSATQNVSETLGVITRLQDIAAIERAQQVAREKEAQDARNRRFEAAAERRRENGPPDPKD